MLERSPASPAASSPAATEPSRKATTALVCAFLSFLNFWAGICAIIIARRELRDIAAGRTSPENRARARTSIVVAVFGMFGGVLLGIFQAIVRTAVEVLGELR